MIKNFQALNSQGKEAFLSCKKESYSLCCKLCSSSNFKILKSKLFDAKAMGKLVAPYPSSGPGRCCPVFTPTHANRVNACDWPTDFLSLSSPMETRSLSKAASLSLRLGASLVRSLNFIRAKLLTEVPTCTSSSDDSHVKRQCSPAVVQGGCRFKYHSATYSRHALVSGWLVGRITKVGHTHFECERLCPVRIGHHEKL